MKALSTSDPDREIVEILEKLKPIHHWESTKVVEVIGTYVPAFDIEFVRRTFEQCQLPTLPITLQILEMAGRGVLETGRLSEYQLPRQRRDELREFFDRHLVHAENQSEVEKEPELASASKELEERIATLSDGKQRNFCEEALLCAKASAFRGSVVMAWNFAIHHLINWILDEQSRISDFNGLLTSEWLNKSKQVKKSPVLNYDDFGSLKEAEIIRIAKAAKLISKSTYEILDGALRKRNDAAHPHCSRTFSSPIVAGHLAELVDFVAANPVTALPD